MKFIDKKKFLESTNFVTLVNESDMEKVTYYLPFKNEKNIGYLTGHMAFLDCEKAKYIKVACQEREAYAILINMIKQRKHDNNVIYAKLAELKSLYTLIGKQSQKNTRLKFMSELMTSSTNTKVKMIRDIVEEKMAERDDLLEGLRERDQNHQERFDKVQEEISEDLVRFGEYKEINEN